MAQIFITRHGKWLVKCYVGLETERPDRPKTASAHRETPGAPDGQSSPDRRRRGRISEQIQDGVPEPM
ncbi:hypothetical protein WMY93_030918 [Mugilogobius chulae]|uniref:Uncharacterized protein n=1 Tax=Mugilogobius chulae TaxID=88201 RepID=A0AAW0MKB9_9GOBI